MDVVLMWHPDVPHTKASPIPVARWRFEAAWKPNGWQEWQPTKPAPKAKETK